MTTLNTPNLSGELFPLLPLRRGVLFPGRTITVPIGRPKSVALAQSVVPGATIVVAVQRDQTVDDPMSADLHPVAVLAKVHRVVRRQHNFHLVVEGLSRFKLLDFTQSEPYFQVSGQTLTDEVGDVVNTAAEMVVEQLVALGQKPGSPFASTVWPTPDVPGLFADSVATALNLTMEQELEVLFTLDVTERLRLIARRVGDAQTKALLRGEIDSEVRKSLTKNQRDALLREQLKAIQRALGDDEDDEKDELQEKLEALDLPPDIRKSVDRELKRFLSLSPNQTEHGVLRNYLEWVASLPWSERAATTDDLNHVAAQLDADHFGLDDVKQRILEHMAVLQVSSQPRGTILCLSGPPGVGKTSLGQSIADATNRPFVRLSLGGVRDEADIRGHRRTYVGAMPGRLMHAMRKAGVKNPVILLDEIDKLSTGGWSGDPEAALLEVLDPEQNHTFTDHYLGQPFDLSEVLFICTVNNLQALSAPLRDRLEVIPIEGYTPKEKVKIARRHLLPDQREAHALSEDTLRITDDMLSEIITGHTREAGVRQLKRALQKICRGVTLEIARGSTDAAAQVEIDHDAITRYLGKQKFFNDIAERTSIPGVSTGLAWTPVGGDILFIETTAMPGKGRFEITGQLGDVMKESARAALAYVRTHADALGVEADFLEHHDLHIHVPAGGVPKDGPSAGVTIFTALTSLLTGRRVRADTAMTGECTLRGRILPVGGIKAKVLAAHRAGIKRVILPERNRRDVDDIPADVAEKMTFIFAREMSQALEAALCDDPSVIFSPDVIADTTPAAAA